MEGRGGERGAEGRLTAAPPSGEAKPSACKRSPGARGPLRAPPQGPTGGTGPWGCQLRTGGSAQTYGLPEQVITSSPRLHAIWASVVNQGLFHTTFC
ncbi:hypothetical protein SKAU_G00429760 [Synaphobranchus kaupii]|uniref:Uncharacterized protein n=1 Tax=Synaphobranchus kaupii TaxID=118154 RepID=A0A9Q1I855_SYNKA|nr:hypothetical protein SKAU_G00429760 [Synaphobranchus kaupii]